MQENPRGKSGDRTPNTVRTAETRAALIKAARDAFTRDGYAATGTPDIVAAAGVTRGALYHHFADKAALFEAVVEAELIAIAAEIEAGADAINDPIEALIEGGATFLAAMEAPGRQRLLLLDAPAVLPRATLDRLDAATGAATLRAGLQYARARGALPDIHIDTLAGLFSAAYDRAALAIASADPPTRDAARATHRASLELMWRGLASLGKN
jgi:AcrR family transcriptional regulator